MSPEERNRLPLIVETTANGVFVYSVHDAGVCVTADTLENALPQLDDAVNRYRSWVQGKPVDEQYFPAVVETYATAAASVDDSRVSFACELAPLPAKTHARMKKEALYSALCMVRLIDGLPDADALLNDKSGREYIRLLNANHSRFAAAVGVDYTPVGDYYADRKQVIAAVERPGFMCNRVFETAEGKWSYRKLLRRLILADRLCARQIVTEAERLWGTVADPFLVGTRRPTGDTTQV